jgi:hypothetical protein
MEAELEKYISDDMKNQGNYKIINLKGVSLCVFKNGEVYRWVDKNQGRLLKNPKWKLIHNVANHNAGYNIISIDKKMILRHRIICHTFKYLDIDNDKIICDHIDGNRINNNINNLRIVNNQQNHFNRTTAKGYSFNKRANKWQASIKLNGKLIYLGLYTNEQDARSAYLASKLIYHHIEADHVQKELNELKELELEFQRIMNN